MPRKKPLPTSNLEFILALQGCPFPLFFRFRFVSEGYRIVQIRFRDTNDGNIYDANYEWNDEESKYKEIHREEFKNG